MDTSTSLQTILELIEKTRGNSDRFAETLRKKRIPHLSFSQVTAVEFCEQRYALQYLRGVEASPIPEYFTKGKVIHQVIARNYLDARGRPEIRLRRSLRSLERRYEGETLNQLSNAVRLHLDNFWSGDVVAVEKPFVMLLHPDLPPCVGVIDLILKNSHGYTIVDHKTGRDFYPQDELQVAIYRRYIKEAFGTTHCKFFYDSYRWVNNLDRIRKPAFVRTYVPPTTNWSASLKRISAAYETMDALQGGKRARREGKCYMCPYRNNCW